MAGSLHGSARTTPRVRAELQASKETSSTLARRYGLSRTTVNKWRTRTTTNDAPMGPTKPRSTVLTRTEEAMIVEFRRRTLLPLDDVLGCLRDSIPNLTRSSLHRCLERYGISRLPESPDKASKRGKFADVAIGTSTSTSVRCGWRKASSTCSSPLTASPSLPTSNFAMTRAK
jgi:transposase